MNFEEKNREETRNKEYNDRYIYSYSEKNEEKSRLKNKKSSSKKKIYVISLIFSIVLGILGSLLIYTYNKLDNINYRAIDSTDDFSDLENAVNLLQDRMVLNIAMFGIDRRTDEDNHSRSDSTMILSIDSRRRKIKLISLMRDIWTKIPYHAKNRLNTAIAFGGEKLAIQTIQNNFGVKIDRYAKVDFESFKTIVDIVGGIDLTLSDAEVSYINNDLTYWKSSSPKLTPGEKSYHLNGEQTLIYARARKVATPEGLHDDFARTYRQRRVLSIIIESMKKCKLNQILEIVEKAGPFIDTNLKKSEILTLGKDALSYLNYTLEEFRLPTDNNVKNANINGMSVLIIPDMKKARYDLAKFIYEDTLHVKS